MNLLLVLRWAHLVAAATWVGGLIVLGPLIVALRRAGANTEQLRAAAGAFSRVTWLAMAIAVITGIGQVEWLQFSWGYPRLHAKLGAVGLAIALAGVHQFTARSTGPAVRGVLQLAILAASLLVVATAVAL